MVLSFDMVFRTVVLLVQVVVAVFWKCWFPFFHYFFPLHCCNEELCRRVVRGSRTWGLFRSLFGEFLLVYVLGSWLYSVGFSLLPRALCPAVFNFVLFFV